MAGGCSVTSHILPHPTDSASMSRAGFARVWQGKPGPTPRAGLELSTDPGWLCHGGVVVSILGVCTPVAIFLMPP